MSSAFANSPVEYLSNGAFNLVYTVSYADLVSTASTSKTVTIATIPTDAAVEFVGYNLVTNFDGGATSALTVKIGDDDDDDGFVVAASVHADSTPISSRCNTGAYFTGTDSGSATTANVIKSKTYDNASTKSLNVVFTATGANLTALTQGKVVFFVRGIDITKIV